MANAKRRQTVTRLRNRSRWLLVSGLPPAVRSRRGRIKPTVPLAMLAPLGARGTPSIAGRPPLFAPLKRSKNSPPCGALERSFATSWRHGGSAPVTPATFEKVDETFTAYGGAVYGLNSAFLPLTSNHLFALFFFSALRRFLYGVFFPGVSGRRTCSR